MQSSGVLVVAFDPGRNIGVARVDGEGALLEARIVDEAALVTLELPHEAVAVVGDGTGSTRVMAILRERGLTPTLVDETGSSLEARELYFRDYPPRVPWRWLPRGMWPPPQSIDHYAAYAIALRYLRNDSA